MLKVTLTFHAERTLKQAQCNAADREHRSVAYMFEVMFRDQCNRNGIPVEEQQVLPLEAGTDSTSLSR